MLMTAHYSYLSYGLQKGGNLELYIFLFYFFSLEEEYKVSICF